MTVDTRRARDLAQIAILMADDDDVGVKELGRAINELATQIDELGDAYERGYRAAGFDATDRVLEDLYGADWRSQLPELAAARKAREEA